MPRIRNHVNPLRADYLEIPVPRIDVPEEGFLDVEIGSAEAEFLVGLAAAWPRGRFVGLEIRSELVRSTNERFAAERINVQSVFANVSRDLPRLFTPGSVRRFYVNFPDPWFKARQHKRRVVNDELVADMHRSLARGGEVFVETDIFDIALDGMAAMESAHAGGAPAFVNALGPWSFLPGNPFPTQSRRERWCLDNGIKIWRLLYRKIDC